MIGWWTLAKLPLESWFRARPLRTDAFARTVVSSRSYPNHEVWLTAICIITGDWVRITDGRGSCTPLITVCQLKSLLVSATNLYECMRISGKNSCRNSVTRCLVSKGIHLELSTWLHRMIIIVQLSELLILFIEFNIVIINNFLFNIVVPSINRITLRFWILIVILLLNSLLQLIRQML